jgi:small multidrug resistance family-3 protein
MFVLAALFEIGGCYAFWAWSRSGRSAWYVVPGLASLVLFALLLTRVESAYAGRAYAAYGGIYIACSLLWLRGIEGIVPDAWDVAGAGISVLGALVILLGRR